MEFQLRILQFFDDLPDHRLRRSPNHLVFLVSSGTWLGVAAEKTILFPVRALVIIGHPQHQGANNFLIFAGSGEDPQAEGIEDAARLR
jgi:hypothetical protein